MLNARIPLDSQLELLAPGAKTKGPLAYEALAEAVDAVQEREPDARPASRTRNADMIDFIVEHVAGPGY
jgi:hypothetical protein